MDWTEKWVLAITAPLFRRHELNFDDMKSKIISLLFLAFIFSAGHAQKHSEYKCQLKERNNF